ncbi:hypothetical protein ACJMK2_008030 [Sinanodonta woodiana]|uniref:Leucine-rich repeat-containing protein 34 n=1 Tax=Sinanodonta woodiana TaxID=1069815 RepID=A0ABD3VMU4_SINWO
MTDILTTEIRYESVCAELEVPRNPYIVKMLQKEKDETIFEAKDRMHLYLAGNNHLLTDKRLDDTDCEVIYRWLQNNVYVESIDLRYNNITDKGLAFIAKLLQENVELKSLNLMCNEIGEDGAKALAKSLEFNEGLKSLKMNGNKIGNKGGMYFAQMLLVNAYLQELDLGDCDLKIESIIALSTILHQNTSIKALNVNRPILFTHQEETTVHFAKMLKVNTTLQELHLQKYDMRDFGATRLAECLMENFTLQYLDLSCNRITRDGVKELAKVLKKNTALKTLDLGYNRLEDDGAMHIADAIGAFNSNLECLVVKSNNINGKGLCALAGALKSNSTLTSIYIWGNNLEESACTAFANLLKTGRIKKASTDVQPYQVDGVTYLSEQTTAPQRHYYWAPNYGDDIPSWQERGDNPRGSNVKMVQDAKMLMT